MPKVFVSGSMRIKNLHSDVLARIDNMMSGEFQVIVGDADGVDTSVQAYLLDRASSSVVVYCTGEKPRNNLGHWAVERIKSAARPGTRAFFTEKDKKMAEDCDYGLMVWDTKSTGTLSNALELVKMNKPALVYINKAKKFMKIRDVADLEQLLSYMNETSRQKADKKIHLGEKLTELRHVQASMF